MSTGQSLPPGPPFGDGTPFGYGDAYGNGFGNSYAYGVAGIGYGGGYGSSSYISSLGGIVSVTPTKTDPKRQYIAARPGQAYTPDIAVTLSAEWDEMLGQSSAVLSRRMLLDPQVRSAWNYFKFSVLADGPILSPAVTPEEGRELTPEEQAECDLAKEITDYCLRQQERIERPIDEVLGQLFDGCIHRGAIVEKVEELIEDGPDKGKRGLKALVTLPSTAWAFVTDLYGKNVGVAGWTADGPKVLDPRHFAVFTWEPKAGDPRGTNILDAAFSAWNEKVSLVPERFRHLVLFGSPSTVYELPEGAQPQAQLDQYGNPDFTRAPIDPIYQGMQQLSAFRGGGQMVHSHGGKVSLIDAANDGGAFTAAKMDCNREIATAILLTPGSTMEAQHDSNANAQTKQDATGILIRRAQARLASVYRGLLKELITPNWGNDVAARLTPRVTFAVEHHDQAATIGTWSQAGWAPDPVQYQEIDAKVGLRTPRPDQAVADDAVEDDQDEKEEEAVFSARQGGPRKKKGKSAESASLGHIESGTHSGHGGNPNHGVDGKFIDGPRMKPETPPPPGPHTADKVQDHLSTILSEAVEYIPGSKMLKGIPRKPRMERMVGRIKEFLGGVDHTTLKQVARMNEVGTKDPLNSLTREYIRIFKSQAGFSDAKVVPPGADDEESAAFSTSEREDDADPFLVTAGLPSLPLIASEDKPCSRLAMMSAIGKELSPGQFRLCQKLEQQYLDGEISRDVLFAYTPCRDARGRFMSCGGAGGAKKSTKAKGRGTKARKAKADKLRAAHKAKIETAKSKATEVKPKAAKSKTAKVKVEPKPKAAKEAKVKADPKPKAVKEPKPKATKEAKPKSDKADVEAKRQKRAETRAAKDRAIVEADLAAQKAANAKIRAEKTAENQRRADALAAKEEAKAAELAKLTAEGKTPTVLPLHQHGDVVHGAEIRAAISDLPETVKAKLAAHGVTIHHANDVASFDPTMANEQPRGWSAGTTWKNADGFYSRGTKKAVVTDTKINSDDGKLANISLERKLGVIRHEIGHAYDDALGQVSQSAEFQSAHRADVASIPKEHHDAFAYFLQSGHAGPSETFAEAFAHLHGSGTDRHSMSQYFPRSTEYIRLRQTL